MIDSPLPSLHPRYFNITFFTRIMSTGLKLGENWDDVPKFSVILSGTRDGGPYKREDFLVGLAGIIRNVSTRVLGKKKYLFLSWPRRTCFARAPETREMAASVDDGTDWAIVRRRSVILSGKKEGKPYVREDSTDSLVSILVC